jgi:hypothetical protein
LARFYIQKNIIKEGAMMLIDTISWLMGRVQRSLFPHLNQCLPTPLTEQEERDAAYDATRIRKISSKIGHVPIIGKNGRGQEVVPMVPHEAERYKIRSSTEWANSRLKEDIGANNLMVKGTLK